MNRPAVFVHFLAVSLLIPWVSLRAQISNEDAEALYEEIGRLESGIQEQYARPGRILDVGTYYAETGHFHHELERRTTFPGIVRPLLPVLRLPERPQIWDEGVLDYEGLYFEAPLFGLDEPLVFTPARPSLEETAATFHLFEKALSITPDFQTVITPGMEFELPLASGNRPTFRVVDPVSEGVGEETIALNFDEQLAEYWPQPELTANSYAYAQVPELGRTLRFELRHHDRPVYVRIFDMKVRKSDGSIAPLAKSIVATAEVGQDEIEIWVGPTAELSWQLVYGVSQVCDRVVIDTPPQYLNGKCCFGTFQLEALPLCIVYEPPQTSEGLNHASYERAAFQRTQIGMTVSEQESTTRPGAAPTTGVDLFRDAVDLAKDLPIISEVPGLGAALGGLDSLLDGLLGTTQVTTVSGSGTTEGHRMTLGLVGGDVYTTSGHAGPGRGDLFVLAKHPRFAWVGVESRPESVQLLYLGSRYLTVSAGQLQDELADYTNQYGLSKDTISALLALDPLAANPNAAALDSRRFARLDVHESASGDYEKYSSVTIEHADHFAGTEFHSKTISHKAGWLGWLWGDKTETVTMRTELRSYTAESAGEEISVAVSLYPDPEGPYAVQVWYDRVFGTFAFTHSDIAGVDSP